MTTLDTCSMLTGLRLSTGEMILWYPGSTPWRYMSCTIPCLLEYLDYLRGLSCSMLPLLYLLEIHAVQYTDPVRVA